MILATVSSDPGFQGDVRAALEARFRFDPVWDLDYDTAAKRVRGLRPDQKCLVIVDFSMPAVALNLARSVCGTQHIRTIAVGCGCNPEERLLATEAGVFEVIPTFSRGDLVQAANRAFDAAGETGQKLADVSAFIPAKPGSGATTVATYAACMASRLTEEPTLLLDFDVRLGLTTFLLKAGGAHSIVDALRQVHRLDPDLWSTLVTRVGSLYLLGSGAADFSDSIPAGAFLQVLDFAVRQYSLVTVDLPGRMEDYECDVLARAKHILLVCTPDIGCLHAARRKSQWLQDLRLRDKVSVVLNCVESRGTLSMKEIERTIQLPVRYLLPTGAKDISRTVERGEILDSACPLGRQIAGIASDLLPAKLPLKNLSYPAPERALASCKS